MIDLLDPSKVITRMFEAGRFEEMKSYCEQLLEKDPTDMLALQNLTLACLHLRRFEDALSYCNRVLGIDEYDTYAIKNKVLALEQLGKYDQVVDCCNKLLNIDSNNIWALNSKGLALLESNKSSEAIEPFERVLSLEEDNLTALMNKALAHYIQKEYEKAASYYDKAQKSDPSLKDAAIAKSESFAKMGKDDEAFLAAQGVLNEDMQRFKDEAKKNNCTVFHQYCVTEFEELESKER